MSTNRTATVRGRFDTTTARYNLQIGNLSGAYGIKELSFFAQDSWRINQKLTVNFGLRFEKQYNPSAEANNTPVLNLVRNTAWPLFGNRKLDPSIIPDSQNEWGPRIGFAYDPMGNGKTVIRGFDGEYYAISGIRQVTFRLHSVRRHLRLPDLIWQRLKLRIRSTSQLWAAPDLHLIRFIANLRSWVSISTRSRSHRSRS